MRLVTLSPSRAGQRRIVDAKRHRQRRRIDRLGVERLGHRRVADGVRDGRVGQAGDGDDVAGLGLLDRNALEPAERQHLGDAAGLDDLAVVVERLDRHVDLTEPLKMRPVRMRPRNCRGRAACRASERAVLDGRGGLTWLTMVSNSGVSRPCGPRRSRA
jgi:hypothetical protein